MEVRNAEYSVNTYVKFYCSTPNSFRESRFQIYFLMVSVVDVEISLKISKEDLLNSGNWKKGWLNLTKSEAITKDYSDYKLSNKSKEGIEKIFVKNDSLFYIT